MVVLTAVCWMLGGTPTAAAPLPAGEFVISEAQGRLTTLAPKLKALDFRVVLALDYGSAKAAANELSGLSLQNTGSSEAKGRTKRPGI